MESVRKGKGGDQYGYSLAIPLGQIDRLDKSPTEIQLDRIEAMLATLLDLLANEGAQDEPQAHGLDGMPLPRARDENSPL